MPYFLERCPTTPQRGQRPCGPTREIEDVLAPGLAAGRSKKRGCVSHRRQSRATLIAVPERLSGRMGTLTATPISTFCARAADKNGGLAKCSSCSNAANGQWRQIRPEQWTRWTPSNSAWELGDQRPRQHPSYFLNE